MGSPYTLENYSTSDMIVSTSYEVWDWSSLRRFSMGDKMKKKLSKKELKALNHAKLMGERQHTVIPGQTQSTTPSNVIPINKNVGDKNKAA